MSEEIIKPRKRTTVTIPSRAAKRAQPAKSKLARDVRPRVVAPVKVSPSQMMGNVIDNSGKVSAKKGSYKERHSNFLITMVPNCTVRDDINPELYKALKEEIASFASYVLEPDNIAHILKPAPGNDDPHWMGKIVKIDDSRVASIEDSKLTNKRLHCHIYYPVIHNTKLQVDGDKVRAIAKMMLSPLGIESPHIDIQVERSNVTHGARDYVMKLGDGKEGGIIIK